MLTFCIVSLLKVSPVRASSAVSKETRESVADGVVLSEVIKEVRVSDGFSLLVFFGVVDLSLANSILAFPKQVFVS